MRTVTKEEPKLKKAQPAAVGFAWTGIGVLALMLSFSTLDSDPSIAENPRSWPIFCAVIMIAAGIGIGVHGILQARGREVSQQSEDVDGADKSGQSEEVVRKWSHVILFAALFVYGNLLPQLGYVAATVLLMLACLWTMGVRQLWKLATISVVLTAATAYLFGSILNVALPRGAGFLAQLNSLFF